MLSVMLSADVGFAGNRVLVPKGGSCACAAPTPCAASRTVTSKIVFLIIWSLRLEPLNVTYKLRTAGKCVRELACVSRRTEVGEIETR